MKTPSGNPVLPFDVYAASQVAKNIADGLDVCAYQRCTGRTTRAVIQALEFVRDTPIQHAVIYVKGHPSAFKDILTHYADELGVPYSAVLRVRIHPDTEVPPLGMNIGLEILDNSVLDEPQTKDVRQPSLRGMPFLMRGRAVR